jgi:alpha-tubulin suppressor-like RCC1 family protein
MACGYYHTVVITDDGELWTCGAGTHGQLGHADRAHQLAPKRVAATRGARLLTAAAGPRDTLVVAADGALWTWGGGNEGQLGHGDMPKWRLVPTRLGPEAFGGIPVVCASAGDDHTIALTADGRVWAWGSGREAQQGSNSRKSACEPVAIAPASFGRAPVAMVAAGDDHSLALTAEGDVYSWGRGAWGRLGHGDELDCLSPTMLTRTALANSPAVCVAAGKFHSAAVTSDGSVWLWGWGEWGQLGAGDTHNRPTPARLKPEVAFGDSRVMTVSCGAFHSLAATEEGAAYTWGRGTHQGGVGVGGDLPTNFRSASTHTSKLTKMSKDLHKICRLTPARIPQAAFSHAKVLVVAAGLLHSAAVTVEGTLYTWGAGGCDSNDPPTPTGLGQGDGHDRHEPEAVSTLSASCHIYVHTCMHTYTYTYIHTYIGIHIQRLLSYIYNIQTHTHTHTYVCMYVYIHTYVHACIHTYIHRYSHSAPRADAPRYTPVSTLSPSLWQVDNAFALGRRRGGGGVRGGGGMHGLKEGGMLKRGGRRGLRGRGGGRGGCLSVWWMS